jgi:cold shock CspA family protein
MRGTLTRFDQQIGKGTITGERGLELLVYEEEMEPSRWPLLRGQAVEFRVYYGPFGPLAKDVRRFVG